MQDTSGSSSVLQIFAKAETELKRLNLLGQCTTKNKQNLIFWYFLGINTCLPPEPLASILNINMATCLHGTDWKKPSKWFNFKTSPFLPVVF